MIGKAIERSFVQLVPNHKLVVIATGGQLTVFGVPFQPTNLLFVARQPPKVLIRRANITVIDEAISRTGCEDMVIPGQSAHTIGVANHGPEPSAMFCIPDLHETLACADCKMGTPLNPAHTGHSIVLQLTELGHSAGLGIPHVDGVCQADTQHVAAAPVYQVQVEIILQIGSIENLERNLIDVAGLLPRGFKDALGLIPNWGGTVEF